jgi:exodeoxyribonuclease VII small subunit
MAEKKEPSFEEIIARLEVIAKRLEAGDTKLEEALALFEEGVKLAKVGGDRLDQAEKKLEILRGKDQAEPFVPESEPGADD